MASKLAALQKPIHLDGTTLEGGGQLLRLALSLSSLTRNSIRITDIRGKRGPASRPGQDGGMKHVHLASAEWLAKILGAENEGMELRSRDLLFSPSIDAEMKRNLGIFEPTKSSSKKKDKNGKVATPDVDARPWRCVNHSPEPERLETTISISTPGSIFLILQAILPWLLFQSSSLDLPEHPNSDEMPRQMRVKVEGGTHAWHAPSLEYIHQVLFPMLHEKVGLPFMQMTVKRLGWSSGRASVGEVWFDFTPLRRGSMLSAFQMLSRGDLTKIDATIYAPTTTLCDQLRDMVVERILKCIPEASECEIDFPVVKDSGHRSRFYLLLVAHTSNGYRLGRDWLADHKPDPKHPNKLVEDIVKRAVGDLKEELDAGHCVDVWMQDQLVVFQALADGKAVIDGAAEDTLHTQTARWVANQCLGVQWDERGLCDGIAWKAGQGYWMRPDVKDTIFGREKATSKVKEASIKG